MYVRIILGLLLLVAAGLKLYGLNVAAVPRLGWLAAPQIQVAVLEWELLLGLWLISGAWEVGAWLAAVGTFLTFAGFSAYFGWIGVTSCGCFGAFRTSPWVAFSIDLGALIALALFRPEQRSASNVATSLNGARGAPAIIPLSAAVILITFTALGTWAHGSPAAAMAHLRGDLVLAEPSTILVHEPKPTAEVVREIKLTNLTDQPIRILGGNTYCSFWIIEQMPFTLAPREQRVVHFELRSTRGDWNLDEQLRLIVHGSNQPIVVAVVGRLTGRRQEKPGGTATSTTDNAANP